MLAIRFQRVGRKAQPAFRIVVAERRSNLGGPPVEDLGSYNPFTKQGNISKERVEHWLKVGAKPTASAHNLFVRLGIISGAKIPIRIKAAGKTGPGGTEESAAAVTEVPETQPEAAA